MKEINNNTRQYNDDTSEHDPFACGSVHGPKIEFGKMKEL